VIEPARVPFRRRMTGRARPAEGRLVVAVVTRARRVAVGGHREVRLRLVGIPVAISTRNRMAMRQRELAERRVQRWQGSRLDREHRAIDLGRIGRHGRHGVVHCRWWRRRARQRDARQSNTHGKMVAGWPPRATSATGTGPEPDIAVIATRRSDERAAHNTRGIPRRAAACPLQRARACGRRDRRGGRAAGVPGIAPRSTGAAGEGDRPGRPGARAAPGPTCPTRRPSARAQCTHRLAKVRIQGL